MIKELKLLLFVSMVLFTVNSLADTGQQRLSKFFDNIKSLQAEFEQEIQSDDFTSSEKSTGLLRMQRPGKFRWDYQKPYEQRIVADGKKLWIYDIDMDQVIVKPLDLALGNTPAVLLSGNASLGERFDIREVPSPEHAKTNKSLTWVELKPKEADSGFQILLLAFGDDLDQMLLTDAFGQVTKIAFTKLVRNPSIGGDVFDFIPPPGVDVLGE